MDVRGLQVEPQAGASAEQASTRGGVYEGARLRDDTLVIETTGVNRHSCTVNIVHASMDHISVVLVRLKLDRLKESCEGVAAN